MADFGLTEDMYGSNYYRRSKSEREERVPVRWMAPESIEMSIYNEATDVVSTRRRLMSRESAATVVCLPIVVFWSDVLGGVHMWGSALCRCPCHDSAE